MRLTCPNCGAQYEVPDQVIPIDGRDVQCSNCGTTWFQDHPDNPQPSPQTAEPEVEDWETDADEAEYFEDPDNFEDPEPEPPADPLEDDDDEEEEYQPAVPERDANINDVLREEAEREARLRAQEEASGLESQPDLGLEPPEDDARRRAEEARARMARLRGEEPAAEDPIPETESRRGLLPDIDEINSSLKNTDKAVAPASAPVVSGARPRRRSGGFSRGIAISLLIALALLLIYSNAPKISAALPQADPALNAYVAVIDNARIWLDQKLGGLIPQQ